MATYKTQGVASQIMHDSDSDAESVSEIDEDSDFLLPTLSSDNDTSPTITPGCRK